jgi:hypothetical protein
MRKLPPVKTRFKPGQSGNPKGRPKRLPELDKLLAEVLGGEDGNTEAEKILRNIASLAKRGKSSVAVRAAEVLLDRAYGRPKQTLETTSSVGVKYIELPAEFRED